MELALMGFFLHGNVFMLNWDPGPDFRLTQLKMIIVKLVAIHGKYWQSRIVGSHSSLA